MESNNGFLGKYIIVGDSQAGKSSLGEVYTKKNFHHTKKSTVGIDLFIKNVIVDGQKYKIQIWDTAGQERFRTLISSYYKGANCVIYCFDVTNKNTFNNLECWINESYKYLNKSVVKCLVGTKIDLENERKVSADQAKKFAQSHNINYFETSSLHNKGIEELFYFLNKQTINIKKTMVHENDDDPIIILKNRQQRNKKCCQIS